MMTLHHNGILPFKYFIESSDLSSLSQLSEKSIFLKYRHVCELRKLNPSDFSY